jgi:hypothetical protein
MAEHEEVIREKDHFFVPKVPGGWQYKNTAHLAVCLNEDATQRKEVNENLCKNGTETKVKNAFSKFVEKVADKNKNGSPTNNILMSSEEFDRHKLNIEWLKAQLEPRFEVHIVVYYRRFHQWIASVYNEIAKKPLSENLDFPSVADWLTQEVESAAEEHTLKVYQRYSYHFQPSALTVLNFHDTSVSLEESFFCRALQGAANACKLTRSEGDKATNSRVSLDWLRILAGLRSREFPDPNEAQRQEIQKRWQTLQELEEKSNSANSTLWMAGDPPPNSTAVIWRKCPSQDMLNKILNMSQSFEEGIKGVLLPISNLTMLPSVEVDFHQRIPRAFCTIDTDRLIDHWLKQNWFKILWEKRRRFMVQNDRTRPNGSIA